MFCDEKVCASPVCCPGWCEYFVLKKVCAVYIVLNGVTIYKSRYESDCLDPV